MSVLPQFNFLQAVRNILLRQTANGHHFERPFMTAYQLAIEFRAQHPSYQTNLPIGGIGTGAGSSLSQHLALELSKAIKAGTAGDVEGAFLSNDHLEDVIFDAGIRSSLTDSGRGVSMFRLKK